MFDKSQSIYKTYEYRIYPLAEQQKLLDEHFDFEDDVYNTLAEMVNGLYAQGAPIECVKSKIYAYETDCVKSEYLASLMHIKKDISVAADKLYNGIFTNLFVRRHERRQRCFYFKTVAVSEFHVVVPCIGAVLRDTHRDLPPQCRLLNCRIFYNVYENIYRAEILVSYAAENAPAITPISYAKAVGLDYAQNGLYWNSNGKCADYPSYFSQAEQKMTALREAIKRAKHGSKRRFKLMARLSKIERHVKNQRKDWQFKTAKKLVDSYDMVAVETLDFNKMKRDNPQLYAKMIDNQFPSFLKKANDYAKGKGKNLVYIDKYYPSSQICSICGAKIGKLPLNERFLRCPECGSSINRDINAAKNILHEGLRMVQ